MVDAAGIEPATSRLRVRRHPRHICILSINRFNNLLMIARTDGPTLIWVTTYLTQQPGRAGMGQTPASIVLTITPTVVIIDSTRAGKVSLAAQGTGVSSMLMSMKK